MPFDISQLSKCSTLNDWRNTRPRQAKKEKPVKVKKVKPEKWPIAVIDFETDPFLYGRIPAPFVAGFYSSAIGFKAIWGKNCVDGLLDFLETLDTPHRIYAHNGGKFDFLFFVEKLDNPIKLINSRIAKAKIGKHELRDSFCIIPVSLATYKKDDIDYRKMEADVREKHKPEILKYLEGDCQYLHELVSAFVARFGPKLTVGSTAIAEQNKIFEIERTHHSFDAQFRPFYFGGRVEAFKPGIHRGEFHVIDVNSMYPYVMAEYDHPASAAHMNVTDPEIDSKGELKGHEGKTYFAVIEAKNYGALPYRGKDHLLFDIGRAEFFATSHEIKAALHLGLLEILEVKSAFVFDTYYKFTDYVERFSAEKIAAKKSGDKIAELFAKFLLNSHYGKYGSNVEAYRDFFILKNADSIPVDWYGYDAQGNYGIQNWTLQESHDNCEIWSKPSDMRQYFNVATAASITGAARAVLLHAIAGTETPFYCDTDSLIYSGKIKGIRLDEKALGAWKHEATGDRLGIAGKKLYALMQGRETLKLASKGARLSAANVFEICEGKEILWQNDAPSMKLSGDHKFIARRIRRT
jgi:hypothetical protein